MKNMQRSFYSKLVIWAGSALFIVYFYECGSAANLKSVDLNTQPAISDQSATTIVHLYFAHKDNSFLAAEERVMASSDDPVGFGKHIMNALIKGPKEGLMRTIPPDAALRAFFITPDGTAYVDLTNAAAKKHPGGCKSEILTIYSIVNSLILNMSDIQAVSILIGGKEKTTLAGHIDMRFPFKADMLLIR
jgi:spore germination protein GerM